MGVDDLVEVVMEVFESLRDNVYGVVEDDDSIMVEVGDYIVTKKFKKGRVEYKLIDAKTGEVLGYIETDGSVYFNVIGGVNWEEFVSYVGW